MTRFLRITLIGLLLASSPARAQFDGPGSTGVSASLIRLFGTNNYFTARAEVQVLGADRKERIGTPMNFTLAGNQIRVEVDMNRMRNREQPDALAQVKPLGIDHVVSIIQPAQRATLVAFPKLRAFVKLELPEGEADAFLRKARIQRRNLGKEKMEGYNCVKQQVAITDDSGQKSEATVWVATDLRDFPVCVATKEEAGTVVIRFRQIQFGRAPASQFAVPAGYTRCADMQVLMAGPVVKYMLANKTAIDSSGPKGARQPSAKSSGTTTKKR